MKNENNSSNINFETYNDDHHYDSFGRPIVEELFNIRTGANAANMQAIIETMELYKNSKR